MNRISDVGLRSEAPTLRPSNRGKVMTRTPGKGRVLSEIASSCGPAKVDIDRSINTETTRSSGETPYSGADFDSNK